MGVFNDAVVTSKGQALLSKLITGQSTFTFSKIETSENRLVGKLEDLTNIGTVKQSVLAETVVMEGTVAKVGATFTNENLTEGYYIRNIGLYAIDPDDGEILFSVSVADEDIATPDYMSATNGVGKSSLSILIATAVGTATPIVVVDPTGVCTVTMLNSAIEVLDNKKVNNELGKGLSTNDFTNELKTKLDNIAENATKVEIEDSLSSTSKVNGLSANQGKILNDRLTGLGQISYDLNTKTLTIPARFITYNAAEKSLTISTF